MLRIAAACPDFLFRYRPFDAAGASYYQTVVRNLHALGHQSARADYTIAANPCMIHDNGPHADQSVVAHRAAVEDRTVTHSHIFPQLYFSAGIHMQHRIVLNIAATANTDRAVIRPQRGMMPDADSLAQPNIPGQGGAGGDVGRRRLFP